MKFRPFPLIAVCGAAMMLAVHAEDAASIESKLRENLSKLERGPGAQEKAMGFFKTSIGELDAYLKANPTAADKLKAQVLQVQLYAATEQDEKAKPMLVELYKQVPKGKNGDLQSAMPLVAMQFQAKLEAEGKKAAGALLDGFEKDFAEHEQMAQIGAGMLQSLRGKLNQPGVGDSMELAYTALDGSKVDLAAMKGKVVLIDFWATWCGPCVGELPNVKQAYKAYHEKGFEIMAVSLDQEEQTLRDFIKKNDMPWAQSFDGKGWQNEIAVKFGIHSIPATFLVGKDGKIVATDLRGPALDQKLAELLK